MGVGGEKERPIEGRSIRPSMYFLVSMSMKRVKDAKTGVVAGDGNVWRFKRYSLG